MSARRASVRGRRIPRRFGAVTLVFAAATGVLVVAALVGFVTGRAEAGIGGLGLSVLAAGLAAHEHRATRRLERVADDVLVLRLALESVAADATRTTRAVERLTGSAERGLRAGLVRRLVPDSDGAADETPEPSLLATLLAFGSRHALFVGEPEDAARLAAALGMVSPTSRLHHVPGDPEEAGAVLDRLATRANTEGLPVPLVLARGHSHVHLAVWGVTGDLIRERYRTRDLLVAVPPGAQSVVGDRPRSSTLRATAIGTTLVLVTTDGG